MRAGWLDLDAEDHGEELLIVNLDHAVLVRVVLAERVGQRLQSQDFVSVGQAQTRGYFSWDSLHAAN